MTQITYPTLFLITHLYPIDTRWIEFLPRLHHGLTEGLTGGGQIGFSDWWWQMAVLTQAEEMFCCWKYKVLNGEATEKSVPRGMLRITITLLRCSSQPGPDRDSFEVAPCAHVGCVQPAVMWVHCLHAAEISERACVCVSCEIGPRIYEYTYEYNALSPTQRSYIVSPKMYHEHTEPIAFRTTASSTARTKGGFASLDVRDCLLFNLHAKNEYPENKHLLPYIFYLEGKRIFLYFTLNYQIFLNTHLFILTWF